MSIATVKIDRIELAGGLLVGTGTATVFTDTVTGIKYILVIVNGEIQKQEV